MFFPNFPLKYIPTSTQVDADGRTRTLVFHTKPFVNKFELVAFLRYFYGFDVVGIATINYEGKKKIGVRSTSSFRYYVKRPRYKKVYARLREPGLAVLPPTAEAAKLLDPETVKKWTEEANEFAKETGGSFAAAALMQKHSNQRGTVHFPPKKRREDMTKEELETEEVIWKFREYQKKISMKRAKDQRRNPKKYARRERAQRILKKDKLKTV